MISYNPICSHTPTLDVLEGFRPEVIDRDYLRSKGVLVEPSPETMAALAEGSRQVAERFREGLLLPRTRYRLETVDPASVQTEIHNYTGRCPTLTYEINPVRGCGVGCQYCLVTDGVHEQELTAIDNYHLYVRRLLAEKNGPGSENAPHYYYFSPKTEAFQETTLLTGIAHRILREFIGHFRENPHSRARLFVASKAGLSHLQVCDQGESILDLFGALQGRMQFNTSVSIMPDAFRDLLEPYAASIGDRLLAVKACQERGIAANSALVQPILTPWLDDETHIRNFFDALAGAGIINYKPEFLTACMENLSLLGPLLGRFDEALERCLWEDYLPPSNAQHRKQRGRTAPDRARSIECLQKMMRYTDTLGMSVSLCYWVRSQLQVPESLIPLVNRNGFQCLGYQRELFDDV